MTGYDIEKTRDQNLAEVSGSNPEVLAILMLVCGEYEKYDSKSVFGYDTPLMWCSTYLPHPFFFVDLFTRLCEEDIEKMILFMTGVRKGFIDLPATLALLKSNTDDLEWDSETWESIKQFVSLPLLVA